MCDPSGGDGGFGPTCLVQGVLKQQQERVYLFRIRKKAGILLKELTLWKRYTVVLVYLYHTEVHSNPLCCQAGGQGRARMKTQFRKISI